LDVKEDMTEEEVWHIQAYVEWRDHHRYPWEWQLDGDEGRYPEDWLALHVMRNIEIRGMNEKNFHGSLKQGEKDFAAKMRGKM